MSWLRRLCVLLAISFLLPGTGCSKKTESTSQVAPSPVEAEDDSPLGQFRKKLKKRRKRRKRAVGTPPSREEGNAALAEARLLLEEADFREAEAELKIAAAAGISRADEVLFRVRSEIDAEDRIVRAQQALNALDYEGARAALEQVPSGLLLSELSVQMLDNLNEKEAARRQAALEKAAQRLEPDEEKAASKKDDGEEAAAADETAGADEPPKADEDAAADEEPKEDEEAQAVASEE